MKFLKLILMAILFASCSRPILSLKLKEIDENTIKQLPVALWYDAEAHQNDTDFKNGLKDLSSFERTCLSDVYPRIEYEGASGIPLFKSSSRNFLNCKNLELTPLSGESFTIVIAFVPTNGIELITVKDGVEEILGIKWLNQDGFIVRTGFASEALIQKTNSLSLNKSISVLKFIYNRNRSTHLERQELWLNDSKVDLTPLTSETVNSGEILTPSNDLTIKASTATEISSLLIFEGELTQDENRDLNCYLEKKYKTGILNCN